MPKNILAAQEPHTSRNVPPGGEVKGDYQFIGEASSVAGANPVGFEKLFGDKDTLFVYNWMYGPKRQRPCPMCTALLSCLDGNADHLRQRIALAGLQHQRCDGFIPSHLLTLGTLHLDLFYARQCFLSLRQRHGQNAVFELGFDLVSVDT
ncbi:MULTISPECIES: DUF899 family protein [unclassified Mesorhizobium]|uniref:DUF899 family protein n=1 Tax=unclassified Mesorhizobium TaxID=325217 RepID=UPI000FE5E4C0|nr:MULTISPECIES: DUF899 family protein [unclassified Mesorhizobium]RWE20608.1 MAG: DUF899 domain-containing protein [Mesorhizobium sp.]TGT57544.1 DUF899 domain-containing protein [Mesorhizobium sp. M00.F.Ca.ET.170.01.1.1]